MPNLLDEDLRRCAGVLCCEFLDGWVVHAHSPREWCVGFDDDVVFLADLSDLGLGVEGVDFDLVDGGFDARV